MDLIWSKYNRRHLAAFMLLWLFVGYIGSISLFMHRHIIDGQTIYHSHFFNGSADNPSHSHSAQQVKVISALSLYFALAAVATTTLGKQLHNFTVVESYDAPNIIQRTEQAISLRAPPVFI